MTVATSGITLSTGATIYTFAGATGSATNMDGWTTLVPSQRQIVQEWHRYADVSFHSGASTTLTSSSMTGSNRAMYYQTAYEEEARVVQSIADELTPRPHISSAQRDEIEQRARNLLLSCLNPDQRSMYEKEAKFRVVSNLGNIFELHRVRTHGVFRLDMQGNKVEEWCVTPHGRIPIDDVLLSQKVMLETDELSLRQEANVWSMEPARLGQQIHRAARQYQGYAAPADYLLWET